VISYAELLDVFWSAHNPTAPSFSRQYRSAIFYSDERQRQLAEQTKKRRQSSGRIYTDIEPFSEFYLAEDYHQKYYLRSVDALMEELRVLFPQERQFVDSTTAARLNGYVGGFGTLEQLEGELDSFGLSEQAEGYIRERVSRR
jgi:peptide-methionine (S)-S-oxide reductase